MLSARRGWSPCEAMPRDASERGRANTARPRVGLALGRALEALGGVAEQEVADLAFDGAADEQAEHAAGVDLQPVGRAGAVGAEVLERPPAVEGLDVAPLLAPADLGGRVV